MIKFEEGRGLGDGGGGGGEGPDHKLFVERWKGLCKMASIHHRPNQQKM